MKELIGFNVMTLAVTMFLTWLICWDLELKEKVIFVIQEVLFLGSLSIGIYLMVGGK